MQKTPINPTGTGWAQACAVKHAETLLFVSGQVPQDADGAVPSDVAGQHRLAWANVIAQLEAAGLGLRDLVKATIYITDRAAIPEMIAVRKEVLGLDIAPALTVVIADLFDARWGVEIEAVAAA
jgi:enamine deaminase RidA (YjgF/YER057c/UK114 family)